jgi:hypothetical protein
MTGNAEGIAGVGEQTGIVDDGGVVSEAAQGQFPLLASGVGAFSFVGMGDLPSTRTAICEDSPNWALREW